jgi:hypothetical protein
MRNGFLVPGPEGHKQEYRFRLAPYGTMQITGGGHVLETTPNGNHAAVARNIQRGGRGFESCLPIEPSHFGNGGEDHVRRLETI